MWDCNDCMTELCTSVNMSCRDWWHILNQIPSFNPLIAAVSLLGFADLLPPAYAVLPGHLPLQPKLTPIQEKMSLHTSSAAFPHSSPFFYPPPPQFYSSTTTPFSSLSHLFSPHPSSLCFTAFLFSHFPSLPLLRSLSLSHRCWSIHSIPGRCETLPSTPIHPLPPWTMESADMIPLTPSIRAKSFIYGFFGGEVGVGRCEDELSFCSSVPALFTPSLLFLPQQKCLQCHWHTWNNSSGDKCCRRGWGRERGMCVIELWALHLSVGLIQTQQPFRIKVELMTRWLLAQCENWLGSIQHSHNHRPLWYVCVSAYVWV